MNKKCYRFAAIILLFISVGFSSVCPPASAQLLWKVMPPYNVLWPLWSPALSPPNAYGVSTPLITSLNSKTVLPVEPALVWDPDLPYFYLLYNNPYGLGVKYYNLYGHNFSTWPPTYLTTPDPITGAPVPAPLTPPTNYPSIISFDPALWLNFWVPIANSLYQDYFYAATNPYLLTAADFLSGNYTFYAFYINIPAV